MKWDTFFASVKTETQRVAKSHGVQQTPGMDLYFGATGDARVLGDLDHIEIVILLVPDYEERLRLLGARQDVLTILGLGYLFSESCVFTILMENPDPMEQFMYRNQTCVYYKPTASNFRLACQNAVATGKSMAIFALGHGLVVRGKDGYVDQEIVFGKEDVGQEHAINGRYMGALIQSFKGRVLLVFVDGCMLGGFPDRHEVEKPDSRGTHANAYDPTGNQLDSILSRNLTASVVGREGFESLQPRVQPLVHEKVPDTVTPPAPQVIDRKFDTMGFAEKLCKKAVKYSGILWNGLEAGLAMVDQGTLYTCLGWTGVVILAACCISFIAACAVAMCFMMHDPIRRLGPVVIVTALATLAPYACDPEVFQELLPFEGAVVTAGFNLCVAAVSMLVYTMMNYDNLKAEGKRSNVLFWSLGFVSQTKKLFAIGVGFYFFDQGPTVQQTVKIRANGTESFVVYHPINQEQNRCFVPGPLGSEQQYVLKTNSSFGQPVLGGLVADFTCDHDIFLKCVAERTGRRAENILHISFMHNQYLLDMMHFRNDARYIQTLLKGEDPALAEMLRREGSRKASRGVWPLRLEEVVSQADEKTYLELVATPFFSFVTTATALASNSLSFVSERMQGLASELAGRMRR